MFKSIPLHDRAGKLAERFRFRSGIRYGMLIGSSDDLWIWVSPGAIPQEHSSED